MNLKKILNKILVDRIKLGIEEYLTRFLVFSSGILLVFFSLTQSQIMGNIQVIVFFLILVLNRSLDFLFYEDQKYNYQFKIFVISLVTFFFVFLLNYYFSQIVSSLNMMQIIAAKFILFLNYCLTLYAFEINSESISKHKNIIFSIFNKMYFYFAMIGIFKSINGQGIDNQNGVKIVYYTISILLIEFIATYIRKNISFISEDLYLKYFIEFNLKTILLSVLVLFGVYYVL